MNSKAPHVAMGGTGAFNSSLLWLGAARREVPIDRIVGLLGLLMLLPAIAPAGVESMFLYHPRPYPKNAVTSLPANVHPLEFKTTDGRQCAFYVAPPSGSGKLPSRLWVLFHGNASLALDWLAVSEGRVPDREAGYLLVDYPGYGRCNGKPSQDGLRRNAAGALKALNRHVGTPEETLPDHLGVLGYSLGAAAALQFAADHPVKQVILIAPFTSLRAIAGTHAGLIGSLLTAAQYDNAARLAELARRSAPPKVLIVHGDRDTLIPVRMGRALAARHPEMVEYREYSGADHGSVLGEAAGVIWETMAFGETRLRDEPAQGRTRSEQRGAGGKVLVQPSEGSRRQEMGSDHKP